MYSEYTSELRVVFDGTNYYIFIFDTINSQSKFEMPLCMYFKAKTPK